MGDGRLCGIQPQLPYPVRGEVHLWWASLADARDYERFFTAWLSTVERQRADQLLVRRTRARRIASRGLLRALLARYADVALGALRFAVNPAGKPHLVEPTTDLQFNVSHSGNLWVCAVTDNQPVGIDVERVRPLSPRHVMPFLAPEERAAWMDAFGPTSGHEGVHALFALWTRKEAYVKARGLGFHLPPDTFAVTMESDRPPRLRYDLHDPEAPSIWTLVDLDDFPGMRGALAISAPFDRVSLRVLRVGVGFYRVGDSPGAPVSLVRL